MKDLNFIQNAFKEAVMKYNANEFLGNLMFKSKLSLMTQSDWDKVLNYVNNIKFPLTIYRGFALADINDLDMSDLGVSWTMDKELFKNLNSAFRNYNYVVIGEIDEEQVDWPETIFNFIHYSLKNISTRYPETEITLKEHTLPKKIIGVYPKEEIFNI
jgi:hypothetical protein